MPVKTKEKERVSTNGLTRIGDNEQPFFSTVFLPRRAVFRCSVSEFSWGYPTAKCRSTTGVPVALYEHQEPYPGQTLFHGFQMTQQYLSLSPIFE